MTPERWQRIDALLQEAVKRPPRERARYLDEFCTDEASRREVESLISFHEQADNFLEVPAFEQAIGLFADQDESLVGLTIGPYRIEKLLGVGGMGEVYLAEDTKLDRRVAIKFLPPDLEADELAKRRLTREAKAAAKLDHPNICATYEVAEEGGRSFIVMQYIVGETLASRVQRKPLGLRGAVDVTVQVADALAEAHSHGIIHRDMKPQNVMITPRGQVKVLDFGLAKMIRAVAQDELPQSSLLSIPGLIMGTASYMSPEQAKGTSVDARTDIFSIGVMLYECITGRLPFAGATTMETIAQVIQVDPPPPSRLNPYVTPELEALTIKALAKDPDARYQSATDLVSDLLAVRATLQAEDHITTRAITPRPASSFAKAVATLPNVFRAPRVFIPAAVAALAIAVTAFLALPSLLRTPYRPTPEALRLYNEGTSALRDGSPYKARNSLQQAVQEDDGFAIAHARLAEAMAELDLSGADAEVLNAWRLVPDPSVLPKLDALYLNAITNVASHHYEDAIASYREIARRVKDSEKPHVYLDLGRTYEKNEQRNEAIASYLKATEFARKEPAAFLRLGVLYGRGAKPDIQSAEEALQKARKTYETQTNYEGITEVQYQRGVLLNSLGRVKEAETELEQAYASAEANKNTHQLIRTLLQLSSVYRFRSDTKRAEQCASRARDLAKENGMETLATQSLIDLGRIYLYRAESDQDYEQAKTYLETALNDARQHKARFNEAAAQYWLANVHIQRHDPDKAVTFIEPAIQFYERDSYSELSRARILLARANSLRGDYDAALSVYESVLEVARATDDQALIARTQADIGNVLIQMERYTDALVQGGPLDASIEIHKSLNFYSLAAYGLADRADALWRLGQYENARIALGEAELADQSPANENARLRAKISLIRANLMLSERRFHDAIIVQATDALDLNKGVEPGGNAKYALGLAQALSGRREGIKTCRDAVETAARYNDVQLLPSAHLALAEALLERGDIREALNVALQAQQKFAANGRRESALRASLVASLASQKAGDSATAGKCMENVKSLLASLKTSWGAEVYNGYIARPDVQNSVRQLGQAVDQNN